MKFHHLAYLPLTAGAIFSASALAQNTITFTGSMEQPTCVAKISGADTGNATVDLGKVNTTDFKKVGATLDPIKFTIQLNGCPNDYSPFAYFYTSQDSLDNGSPYRLRNTHTPAEEAAKGLAVMLIVNNDTKSLYSIGTTHIQNPKRYSLDPKVKAKNGNAQLVYFAQYTRTGELIPGAFKAQVNYLIHYD